MAFGKTALVVFIAVVATSPTVVPAQNGTPPAPIINQRVDAMDRMATAAKAISTELNRASDPAVIKQQALAIQMLAGGIPDLFPVGSGVGQTNAKPEIWANWPDFLAKAKALDDASGGLAESSARGDHQALVEKFQALGQACADCHQLYRTPKR